MPARPSVKDTSSEERVSTEDASEKQLVIENNNGADEDDSDEEKPKKGGGNQGRRKIDIEFIEVCHFNRECSQVPHAHESTSGQEQ